MLALRRFLAAPLARHSRISSHGFAGVLLLASSLGIASAPANAAIIHLDFEGINATYPSVGYAAIQDFYNGGTSSDGTSGTNHGIAFGNNALAICLNLPTATCSNTSRGGFGDPSSQKEALFFLEGSETFLNYPAGFSDGFAFNYVSYSYSGSVDVHAGLNGTGAVLASLNLSPTAGTCPGYSADFCPFSPIGVLFSGTAQSIGFGGVANQIVFDDVTFGSATPGPDPSTSVPAPLGIAGLATGFRFSRRLRARRSRRLISPHA
jgi:hypothetical protein